MKKRLLSMFIALLGVTSMFAYEVGDYIYTRTGRYQVTGANLLTNGDFTAGLESAVGSMYNGYLSPDTFALYTEGGPDNKPYIKVVEAKTTNWQSNWVTSFPTVSLSTHLYAKVMRNAKQVYVLTYKAKSGSEGVSLTTSIIPYNGRSDNYQTFYADADGAFLTPGSTQTINNALETIPDEWTEYSYEYISDEAGFLHLMFGNLPLNECFADFGIYPVTAVTDDRRALEVKEQLEFYAAHADLFPNGQDIILGLLEQLNGMMEADNVSEEFLNNFNSNNEDDPIKYFLDANSVDVTSYFKNFYDGGDGWTGTGTKWSTPAAAGTFYSQYVSQNAKCGTAANSVTAGDYSQTVDLPGGQYLYVVRAQAHKYGRDGSGKNSNYLIPRTQPVEGIYAFINDEKLEMSDIPATRSKIYMKVLSAEDGPKAVGFHSPGNTEETGANFCFDNIQFRLMGKTAADVEAYFWAAKWEESNNALTVMTDSAKKVVALDKYIFGKQVLNDSIAISENVLKTAVSKNEESVNILNTQVKYMRAAINAYYTLNVEYVQLGEDIAKCKVDVVDETRPLYRNEFNAAIATAEGVYKGVDAAVRDSAALVDADKALLAERLEYLLQNAAYSTPADITLVNNTFQKKNATGWVTDGFTGSNKWKFGANSLISEGYNAYYNRGNSADDTKSIYQTVAITKPGVYVVSCEGAIHNSTWNSIQPTGVYLFAGNDSVEICTVGPGDRKNSVVGAYDKFSARAVLSAEDIAALGDSIKIGVEKPRNSANGGPKVNIIYIGAFHLKYYGPYDKYLADSMAIVMKPTKDSLQVAINAAQVLYDEARNPNNVDTTPFTSAIATAQGVHDNASATLSEVLAQFDALANATEVFTFSGVWPAEGKYYDHSKLLKNTLFNATPDAYENWIVDTEFGDSLRFISTVPGYVYGQFNSTYGHKSSAKMDQEVSGLLNGAYAFAANAVYRYAWKESWVASDYEVENVWAALTTSTDTVYVQGLMHAGAKLLDEADTKSNLVYPNGAKLGIDAARHWNDANGAPSFVELFETGLFMTEVPLTPVGGTAKVGFYVNGIPNASGFIAYKPGLRFYGDKIVNGIESIKDNLGTVSFNAGDIYTITGVKVRSNANSIQGLQKGMYIMNGKKFIVK